MTRKRGRRPWGLHAAGWLAALNWLCSGCADPRSPSAGQVAGAEAAVLRVSRRTVVLESRVDTFAEVRLLRHAKQGAGIVVVRIRRENARRDSSWLGSTVLVVEDPIRAGPVSALTAEDKLSLEPMILHDSAADRTIGWVSGGVVGLARSEDLGAWQNLPAIRIPDGPGRTLPFSAYSVRRLPSCMLIVGARLRPTESGLEWLPALTAIAPPGSSGRVDVLWSIALPTNTVVHDLALLPNARCLAVVCRVPDSDPADLGVLELIEVDLDRKTVEFLGNLQSPGARQEFIRLPADDHAIPPGAVLCLSRTHALVVWVETTQPQAARLVGRFVNLDARRIGPVVEFDAPSTGRPLLPAVCPVSDGRFLLTWLSPAGDSRWRVVAAEVDAEPGTTGAKVELSQGAIRVDRWPGGRRVVTVAEGSFRTVWIENTTESSRVWMCEGELSRP